MATLISQTTLLPIIDDYVEVPDLGSTLRLSMSDALAAIPGSYISNFTINKQQRFFVLPTFERSTGYTEDWFAILRAAAS